MAIQFGPQQEQPQDGKTYKVGDTFLHKNKEPYMIVVSGPESISLSCLTDGYRWGDGSKVPDFDKITQAEFDKLTRGQSSEFTQRDFELILI